METSGRDNATLDVGMRLRGLRDERNISMRALARRSGLSANALSMIERGLTSPSVSTLNKLAGALEVPVTAFFRQEPPRSKTVFRKADQRTAINTARGVWEGLGGENFSGRVEPFLVSVEEGAVSGGEEGMIHSGYEFVLCLEGKMHYKVADQTFEMDPGDSLIFMAQQPHRWINPGPEKVKAIIVLSGFDESERPSEYHVLPVSVNKDRDEA